MWEGCIYWDVGDDKVDARTLRVLPQNQEVFLESSEGTDSWHFDLMARVDEADDHEAARVHWEELGAVNESQISERTQESTMIHSVGSKGGDLTSIPLVYGMQGSVRVWMALMRLESPYDTDVVMTWNETKPTSETLESSKEAFQKLIVSVEWNDIDFMI